MSHAGSFFLPYLIWWRPLGYVLVFLGMVFEGDAVLFAAAFLTHRGAFDIGDILFVVFSGVLIGDALWYWAGAHLVRVPFIGQWLERITGHFDDQLLRHPLRSLFISKFAYGLHHPLLMRAGAIGMGFGRFFERDVLASILWVVIVGGLGYGTSASFHFLRRSLHFAERVLVLGFVFFFLIEWILRRSSRQRLSRTGN